MNIKLSGWIKNHESQNAKGWGGTLKVPCSNQSAVFVSGGKLICFLISFLGPQETTVAPPRDWEEIKGCDFPLLFYGVKGKQMREGESPSYFNPGICKCPDAAALAGCDLWHCSYFKCGKT
jgi:hypothetical protein